MIVGYRDLLLYSKFQVGRGVLVRLQAQNRDFGVRSPWNFSASKWDVRLRFAPYPIVTPGTFDRDYPMTKLATNIAQVLVVLPTARERLHVEWVAVETDVDDGDLPVTPSGKKEWALDLPWIAMALTSP